MPTNVITSKEIAKTSGNTDKTGAGTEYRLVVDANGYLQIDIIASIPSAAILTQLADWDYGSGGGYQATVPFGTPNGLIFFEFNVDANGHLQVDVQTMPTTNVRIMDGDGATLTDVIAAGADNLSNTLNQLIVGSFTYGYDGVNWVRIRSVWDVNEAVDLDDGYALQTVASLFARWDDTTVRPLQLLLAGADNIANTYNSLIVASQLYGFDGIAWDRLRSDPITNALRVINAEHAEIHEAHHYFVSDIDIDIDIATPKYWHVQAPDSAVRIHFTWEMETQNAALIEVFENPTLATNGAGMTEWNNDRNSGNTSNLNTYRDPNVTVDGTLIYSKRLVSDKKSGGFVKRSHEIILDQAASYLFKITTDADDNEANIFMEYYEE